MNTTWKAGFNHKFNNMTLEEVKLLLGTVVDSDWVVDTPMKYYDQYTLLPTEFNSIDNWPECKSLMETVNDQSNCGSCFSWSSG